MGCCLSCLGITETEGGPESELQMSSKSGSEAANSGVVSRSMSDPNVKISGANSDTVSGHGLALISVSVEQDAAYWEWHVEKISPLSGGDENDAVVGQEELEGENGNADDDDDDDGFEEVVGDVVKFGVSSKKKPGFYKKLSKKKEELSAGGGGGNNDEGNSNAKTTIDDGTSLMRGVPNLKDGDTVGVAVQQSDLPMVQFLINGEPIHSLAINRWRGTVYPSVWLAEKTGASGNGNGGGRYKVTLVLDEDRFRELAPHARFGPLIAARGII